jgi:nitrogen-specific signal transduction histidine kinase
MHGILTCSLPGLPAYRGNCNEKCDYTDCNNNGSGIKSEDMQNVFIPFFTTKENGSGIGLSIARSIMRLHNGNINMESFYGEGTRVLISFRERIQELTNERMSV